MLRSTPVLETVSVVDALRVALRERILDGSWRPGSVVAEVDIAREFGVSRPSAKTAIRALVFEGLLRHEANRAARVAIPTGAAAADLFLVRIPLELTAIELVTALDDDARLAAVRQAEQAIGALRALPADASHSTFVREDLLFHQRLIDAVASPRLTRTYAGLRGEIHLCMVHTRRALGRDRIVREHSAILRGVRGGDPVSAREHMLDHLTGARDALVAALSRAPLAEVAWQPARS